MSSALLQTMLAALRKPEPAPENRVLPIPVARILPNPAQPRRSFNDERLMRLADSVRRYGILQPLTVRKAETRGEDGEPFYELIAGERRLRAARLAGLREVPCLLTPADDRRSAEIALLENVQREDLNVFEQAAAAASLIGLYGLTQSEAASLLGVSQPALANKLRLLHLTAPERRLVLLREAAKKSLNVRQLEALVDRELCPPDPPERRPPVRTALRDLRIVSNTIDRAVEVISRAGLSVASEKHEADGAVEFVIRVSRPTESADPPDAT